jgi:hypothetical protein
MNEADVADNVDQSFEKEEGEKAFIRTSSKQYRSHSTGSYPTSTFN